MTKKKLLSLLFCLSPLFFAQNLKAEGPTLPYTLKNTCEGEGCSSGNHRNCHLPSAGMSDVAKVYAAPTKRSQVLFEIKGAEAPEVKITERNIVVTQPYAYRLKAKDIKQSLCQNSNRDLKLNSGDKIYILAYAGEGFYSAWHSGKVISCDEKLLEGKESTQFDTAKREPWCKIQLKNKTGWITNTQSKDYL